ncbi:MAG: hypothetical protein DDT30_01438 [Dehalococcoidia bacterium]|nr:hypothetical protein [Bacillota bacterium]
MCINMPKTIKKERLRWGILSIFNREVKLKDTIKACPNGKRTLERWISNYRKYREIGVEPKSTRPKTNPSETPIRIKERIIELSETNLCAKKLFWKLEKKNIVVNKNTIQKIIKKEGLVRKYRIRKLKHKYIKIPLKQGELQR